MESQKKLCEDNVAKTEKSWNYVEYYIGDKDDDGRRNGKGENHWSGAKSLEWYHGRHHRDTMHGFGEYRWRYLGPEGTHFTYEGYFYCNRMHGYGTMSYPDGKTFTGLFHSNIRWGPGIESQACLKQDVGVWRGTQLIRLTWRPKTPSITPDFCTTPAGRACVDPHRIVLSTRNKTIGKTNSALDMLKQYGSNPLSATEKWMKLYPKNCTDLSSLLCNTEVFERDYYKGKIILLEEINMPKIVEETPSEDDTEVDSGLKYYYAWNNNKTLVHMMKHSFTLDEQRNHFEINLANVLSGSRGHFKQPGKHELDCRTLLMASYLGHIQNVLQLINEQGVHPDVADSQGNTAVMYATCGDRQDIIHFLVEAGANVDGYNDACCTPLGMAMLRLACVYNNISPGDMLQALLPSSTVPIQRRDVFNGKDMVGQSRNITSSFSDLEQQQICEWHIERSQPTNITNGTIKLPSKQSKTVNEKKVKGELSSKDLFSDKKKTDPAALKSHVHETSSEESFTEDKRLYYNMNNEFIIRINDLYSYPTTVNPIPYIFGVCDMVKDIDITEEETKKVPDKGTKRVPSKVIKDTMKPSKEIMWQGNEKDDTSLDSSEKQKEEKLSRVMLTILQLLADGANPKLVTCPHSAIFTAIMSGCPNLIEHLVNYGADINELYPMVFGYTPLDLAVSRPLSFENLEMVKVVLKCGGLPNHRLNYEETTSLNSPEIELHGPSLLHAVLAKQPENEVQEEIQHSLLEVLLDYGCNPIVQFKGRSALEIAMTKNMRLLNVFIENRTTNLNSIINDGNQSLLVKFFSMPFFKNIASADRVQTLTNLLLFGADPLLECRNGEDRFPNIFVFAKKTLTDLENIPSKSPATNSPNKADSKKVKEDPKKPKKEQLSTKPSGKMITDDVGDYKQAIDLIVECARLLHVRWLQAKLTRDLVEIIVKFNHRQWNMIMKEHKHKKGARLWLNAQRCLEIWDIMKETKKKNYNDSRILKYLLNIVMYYNSKTKILATTKLTADEKYSIELTVCRLLKERKMTSKLKASEMKWKRPYVQPELTPKTEELKFNVCFECALPFDEEKIECMSCKLVAFCSIECIKTNIGRANCHPCSEYIKRIYFSTPSESDNLNFDNDYLLSK